METKESQRRLVAVKTRIGILLAGQYIEQAGWEPNYVQLPTGQSVSRVNIIAVAITAFMPEMNGASFFVEDNTGRMQVRTFDDVPGAKNVLPGDILLIIGKPRSYQQSIYIVPDAVKKLDNKRWVDVRAAELRVQDEFLTKRKEVVAAQEISTSPSPQPPAQEDISIREAVFLATRKLDSGQGAAYEAVFQECSPHLTEEVERAIQSLLQNGDLFECTPGKLKVLE